MHGPVMGWSPFRHKRIGGTNEGTKWQTDSVMKHAVGDLRSAAHSAVGPAKGGAMMLHPDRRRWIRIHLLAECLSWT